MSKLKIYLLTAYLMTSFILFLIAFIANIVFLYKGIFEVIISVIVAFTNVVDAVHMFSDGIWQIVVSACIFGVLYMFLAGSILSPFYVKKLIDWNKLPIGRKKS